MPFYSSYFPYTVLPIVLVGVYFLIEKHLTKPWMRWAWWTVSIVIVLLAGWQASHEQYWYDFFKGYYHAGRKIQRNIDVLYDESCYGYVNYPLLAYIFIPFGNLPKELAGSLFFIASYVSVLPLAYWLIRFTDLKGTGRFILLGLLALSGPLDYGIWLGNVTHMILLVILLALFLLKQGREWVTGILLGIVGTIKIPLIIPSGYFFLRSRWKVVIGGLAVVAILTILSLRIIPFETNRIWLDRCILSVAGNPIPAYNNQSVVGFLAREFMPGDLSWNPIAPTPAYQWTSTVITFLLYFSALVIIFLGRKLKWDSPLYILEFFIVLACSLLTSPISWTHYFVLLLAPAAFYLSLEIAFPHKFWMNVLFGVSMILISTPINLTTMLFERTGEAIFYSLHFIGAALFYIFLVTVWAFMYRQLRNTDSQAAQTGL